MRKNRNKSNLLKKGVTTIALQATCASMLLAGMLMVAKPYDAKAAYISDGTIVTIDGVQYKYVRSGNVLSDEEEMHYEVVGFTQEYDANQNPKYTNVVIPNEMEDVPVTMIADKAFYKKEDIKSVTLPEGIDIGEKAFAECEDLENISFPESVWSIGSRAFANCTSLKKVKNYNQIEGWGGATPNGLFAGCTNLEEVIIPKECKNIGWKQFVDCTKLNKITFEDIDTADTLIVEKNSFQNTKLWNDAIANKETVVSDQGVVLWMNTDVEHIKIKGGKIKKVWSIAQQQKKKKVKKITISDVDVICVNALSYVNADKVVIKNVGTLKHEAIGKVKKAKLKNVDVVETRAMESVNDAVFVQIGRLEYGEERAYLQSWNIVNSLTIRGVKKIGKDSMIGSTKKIKLTDVDVIEEKAFEYITVKHFEAKNVKEIKEKAFLRFKADKMILHNVKKVGNKAFCFGKVQELTISKVKKIGKNVFKGNKSKQVILKHVNKLKSTTFGKHKIGNMDVV